MGWAQILSLSRDRFEEIQPLIGETHAVAVENFNKKIARSMSSCRTAGSRKKP